MSERFLDIPFDNYGMLMEENWTSIMNGTFGNVTVNPLTLTTGEMIAASIIGLLGLAGIVMNLGVLIVVYNGNLVKTDHRMLYYIFMTCGDLMFALHSFLNVFSILFKEFYVFKIFAVCLNIQIILGVASYQWSAVCIILLIVDLTWSVVYPFTENSSKKLFSKITCIGTFVISLALSGVPFLFWNDAPSELAFCSIGNVYGAHWDFYQQEAVSVLSVLLFTMVLSCISLLLAVYRTSKPVEKSNPAIKTAFEEKPTIAIVADGCHSPHPNVKDRVVSISGSIDEPTLVSNNVESSVTAEDNEKGLGHVNVAFQTDENGMVMNGGRTASKQFQDTELAIALQEARKSNGRVRESYSQADVRHKRFITACRTVMFFVATYIGCCLPYYVLMVTRIGCGSDCTEDTPEIRRTRTIVAATLYLLPIVDPILYIKRFKLFNQTLGGMLKRLRNCCRRA